ncbi:MAG: hypothetical protein RMI83_00555 [Desulfurococcaceae archaeon]|nr:hypothetical protein [Sulfolobales archaeon]MDW8169588.1 hypothetical protein [Desulfurococcaceae archaeon]
MRINIYIGLTALIGALAGLSLLLSLPSTTPYSILNTGSDGLSTLNEAARPDIVTSYSELSNIDPQGMVLITMRSSVIELSEALYLRSYLEKGGIAIAFGSTSFLNSLLENMGLPDRLNESIIYDVVFNNGDREHPVAYVPTCDLQVILHEPRAFNNFTGKPIIHTSNISYLDANCNGYLDIGESIASSIVGVEYGIGGGRLIIVSSSEVFTNSLMDVNKGFLECIKQGRDIIIDQAVVKGNVIEYLKLLGSYRKLYILFITFIVVLASLVIYYASRS